MKSRTRSLASCLLLLSAALPLAAQVEIDNDWVRVQRVKRAHAESFVVRGPSVLVYLSDTREHKPGDVSYVDRDSQQIENPSDRPLEIAVIELKREPSHAAPVALDPVKLDPEHHIVVLDNERVRVLRTILDPHVKAPMHEHPHYVVAYITELHTTMSMADGRNIDNVRKPGEIAWRDALKHATENVGERRAIEIQVELK